MVHSCTDSITKLGHVNVKLEQNRHDQIITYLDSQYQQIGRNVPRESHLLFGDNVTNWLMTLQTQNCCKKKNHIGVQKTSEDSLKTLRIVLHMGIRTEIRMSRTSQNQPTKTNAFSSVPIFAEQ